MLDTVRADAIDGNEQRRQRARELIRGHWGIEKAVRWSLDVGFREDHLSARIAYLAAHFSVLRKIAQNLLRTPPEPGRQRNLRMAKKRFVCAMAPEDPLNVLTVAEDSS
ncbi:MAG: hypothetical protein ACO3JL_15905 [Myxococcota bacterium]